MVLHIIRPVFRWPEFVGIRYARKRKNVQVNNLIATDYTISFNDTFKNSLIKLVSLSFVVKCKRGNRWTIVNFEEAKDYLSQLDSHPEITVDVTYNWFTKTIYEIHINK